MNYTYNKLPKKYKIMSETEYTPDLQNFIKTIVRPNVINLTKHSESNVNIIYIDIEESQRIFSEMKSIIDNLSEFQNINEPLSMIKKTYNDLQISQIDDIDRFILISKFTYYIDTLLIYKKIKIHLYPLILLIIKYNDVIIRKIKLTEWIYIPDLTFAKNIFLASNSIIFNDIEVTNVIIFENDKSEIIMNIHLIGNIESACLMLTIKISDNTSHIDIFFPNFNSCHMKHKITSKEYMNLVDIINGIFKINKCTLYDAAHVLLCKQDLAVYTDEYVFTNGIHLKFINMLYNKPTYYERYGYTHTLQQEYNNAKAFLSSKITNINDINDIYNHLIISTQYPELKIFLTSEYMLYTGNKTVRDYFKYLYTKYECTTDKSIYLIELSNLFNRKYAISDLEKNYIKTKNITIQFGDNINIHKYKIFVLFPRYISSFQWIGFYKLPLPINHSKIIYNLYIDVQILYLEIDKSYYKINYDETINITNIETLSKLTDISIIEIPNQNIVDIIGQKDITLKYICDIYYNFTEITYIDKKDYIYDIILKSKKYQHYYDIVLRKEVSTIDEHYNKLCICSYLRTLILKYSRCVNLLVDTWNNKYVNRITYM